MKNALSVERRRLAEDECWRRGECLRPARVLQKVARKRTRSTCTIRSSVDRWRCKIWPANGATSRLKFATQVREFPCAAQMPAFVNVCSFHRLYTCSRQSVLRVQAFIRRRYVPHRNPCLRRPVLLPAPTIHPLFRVRSAGYGALANRQQTQSYASSAVEPLLSHVKIVSFPLYELARSRPCNSVTALQIAVASDNPSDKQLHCK